MRSNLVANDLVVAINSYICFSLNDTEGLTVNTI